MGHVPGSAAGVPGSADPALLLAYDFPPMGGGMARALGEIARHARGKLIVSTGGAAVGSPLEPAYVRRAPIAPERLRTLPGLLGWSRSAGRIAAEESVGFVWSGNLKPAGYVAHWLARRRRLSYGLIVYGLDVTLLLRQIRESRHRRLLARTIIGGAAGAVAISRWTASRFHQLVEELALPAVADRVRVVPLGADPDSFTPSGSRATLGPGRWLLSVARLMPHKGIDTGIAALAVIARSHPDVNYAIVGEGADRPRLEAIVRQHGLAGRVRFLGAVPDLELPGVYRAAELYLGLSREEGVQAEGFGLALAEAQASAVAVVGAMSGGIADTVAQGVTGVLVPPDDPAAAARAVSELLDHSSRARDLGAAGRLRVERYLNWSRVVSDLADARRVFES